MHARTLALLFFSTAAIAAAVAACGDAPVDATIAQAVRTENKTETARKKIAEAESKEHTNRKAAKAASDAAREAELAAAVALPDDMPLDLEAACDTFIAGFDVFMKAGSEKDVLGWWDGRRRKLGEHRAKCMRRDSIALAACGSVALRQPLASLVGTPREEAAQLVLRRCDDRFGKT